MKTIKQKLIVKQEMRLKILMVLTVCTTTQWEITRFCFYDSAEEAKNACEKLKKDLPGTTNISRYTNHTKRSSKR